MQLGWVIVDVDDHGDAASFNSAPVAAVVGWSRPTAPSPTATLVPIQLAVASYHLGDGHRGLAPAVRRFSAGPPPERWAGLEDGMLENVTSVEPELWVGDPAAAIDFYARAFSATVLHRVGLGNEIVAQLAVGDARFWVSNSGDKRFDPVVIGGTTSRTLLVTSDPGVVVASAVEAGAELTFGVCEEHGWRLGRIVDPFGHEWEIGHPVGNWPPA